MEQSGIVGFSVEGNAERVTDFRDAPFCSQLVFAEMLGIEDISPDVVRGWVESQAIPTVKIGRRRVINLHRIRRELDRGKSIFCAGDYSDD
ncbi:helix-turn-helix domain-containing protein [Pseudomonas sp. S9]|uniref:helix-turn-helix domain-containing protein n=1 Tax=Pseudomonas sp. S9 TaxID=686578 RepID=UPI0002557149|nr:helix-turn-helix domain-containing protein [Pseudomonas sp. S9]